MIYSDGCFVNSARSLEDDMYLQTIGLLYAVTIEMLQSGLF